MYPILYNKIRKYNKNVDIEFSAPEVFLEQQPSDTFIVKRLKSQIFQKNCEQLLTGKCIQLLYKHLKYNNCTNVHGDPI